MPRADLRSPVRHRSGAGPVHLKVFRDHTRNQRTVLILLHRDELAQMAIGFVRANGAEGSDGKTPVLGVLIGLRNLGDLRDGAIEVDSVAVNGAEHKSVL